MTNTATLVFNGEAVASLTYVYSGWVEGEYDKVVAQIGAATIASPSGAPILYRIEGRNAPINRSASISSGVISNTTVDVLYEITEKMEEYRIGLKLSSTVATPNSVYAGFIQTDLK